MALKDGKLDRNVKADGLEADTLIARAVMGDRVALQEILQRLVIATSPATPE